MTICIYCHLPIEGASRGAGDGRGQDFAHPDCYDLIGGETYEHRCQMCIVDLKVTVRIESEFGEYGGGVIGSWPEFDLDIPCPGPPPQDEVENEDGKWVVIPAGERKADDCPFARLFGDNDPEQDTVLAMMRERHRIKKLLRERGNDGHTSGQAAV